MKPFKSFLGTSASAGSSAAADLSTNNTFSEEQGLGGNGHSPGGGVQFVPEGNTSAESQTAAPPASGEEAAPKTGLGSSGTTAEGGAGTVDTSGAVCDTGLVISILVSIIVTVIVVTSAVALYCYFCVMGKDGYLSMPGVADKKKKNKKNKNVSWGKTSTTKPQLCHADLR